MNTFQNIFDKQKELYYSDETKSYEWRLDQLNRMEKMLSENADAFSKAVYDDFRKPPFDQISETAVPLGFVYYYREHLKEFMASENIPVPKPLQALGNSSAVYKEPYGVTLVIGPFNSPVILLLDPAIAALAAGNPVILKPSNRTPEVSRVLSELVPKYFAPEAVSVALGGRQEIAELLTLPFDFIFFTGSTKTGKVIAKAAAENLTPVVLELGGQNPTIVDETANLDMAADRVAWGRNAISGQWCIAPGYVYVHESVAEGFLTKLKASIIKMYGTDAKQTIGTDLTQIITERDVERIASYITPEKVVYGGNYDVKERYVEPTVLYPSTWEDPAMKEEIFGPVLPVLPYSNLKEVFDTIKRKPKPLAAYFFSKNQKNIDAFLNSVPFGGGAINQTNLHCWIETLPFGGVGMSGIGKYYGKTGFDLFSNARGIMLGDPDVELDVYPPYAEKDLSKMFNLFK